MRQKGKRHVLLAPNTPIRGMHEDLNWPAEPVVSQKRSLFSLLVLPEFL